MLAIDFPASLGIIAGCLVSAVAVAGFVAGSFDKYRKNKRIVSADENKRQQEDRVFHEAVYGRAANPLTGDPGFPGLIKTVDRVRRMLEPNNGHSLHDRIVSLEKSVAGLKRSVVVLLRLAGRDTHHEEIPDDPD